MLYSIGLVNSCLWDRNHEFSVHRRNTQLGTIKEITNSWTLFGQLLLCPVDERWLRLHRSTGTHFSARKLADTTSRTHHAAERSIRLVVILQQHVRPWWWKTTSRLLISLCVKLLILESSVNTSPLFGRLSIEKTMSPGAVSSSFANRCWQVIGVVEPTTIHWFVPANNKANIAAKYSVQWWTMLAPRLRTSSQLC